MSQLPQSHSVTPRSTLPLRPTSFQSQPQPEQATTPRAAPLRETTTTTKRAGRSLTHLPPTPPSVNSPTHPKTSPSSHSCSSGSTSTCVSPSPSPPPRPPRVRPTFPLTQPLGRPTDLHTFLENIQQLKRLIVKAKNTLRGDRIAVLERELVGGEHGWRVGLAVAYLDGFLKGGGGVG